MSDFTLQQVQGFIQSTASLVKKEVKEELQQELASTRELNNELRDIVNYQRQERAAVSPPQVVRERCKDIIELLQLHRFVGEDLTISEILAKLNFTSQELKDLGKNGKSIIMYVGKDLSGYNSCMGQSPSGVKRTMKKRKPTEIMGEVAQYRIEKHIYPICKKLLKAQPNLVSPNNKFYPIKDILERN